MVPMFADIRSTGDPDNFMCLGVVEELRQIAQSSEATRQVAMQADRHHSGGRCAFFPDLIEAVVEIVQPIAINQRINSNRPHSALDRQTPDDAYWGHEKAV